MTRRLLPGAKSSQLRHGWPRGLAAFSVFLVLTLTGCHEPESMTPQPRQQNRATRPVQRDRSSWRTTIIGHSVEGRPIQCYELGRGSKSVLIIATIHGNETAGTQLVQRLAHYIAANPVLPDNRRAILVPVANPDGFAHNARHNARGIDLNRNFPAGNFQADRQRGAIPLSEPESRALYNLINRHRPDHIVSIHQPISCVDFDGPGESLARAMSSRCGLPVRKLGGRPGSLGSYAGITLNIPIITFELPRSADALDENASWSRYGPALLEALRFVP